MYIIKYSNLFCFYNLQAKRSMIISKNNLILIKLFFYCIFIFTNHENRMNEIKIV